MGEGTIRYINSELKNISISIYKLRYVLEDIECETLFHELYLEKLDNNLRLSVLKLEELREEFRELFFKFGE